MEEATDEGRIPDLGEQDGSFSPQKRGISPEGKKRHSLPTATGRVLGATMGATFDPGSCNIL